MKPMNCEEARRHWNLYHDSEGDSELYMQINEHLGDCPACAQWFHEQSRLEEELSERLAAGGLAADLWQGVLAQAGLTKRSTIRRWFVFGSVVAVAASLLVAVILGRPGSAGPDLPRLTAEHHDRLVGGRQVVQFASTSDLEVEAYLRGRVNFPVRCPPRQDAGFLVEGAGICRLADSRAAYLLGAVEGRPVSIFIMPKEELERFPHQQAAVHREGTHACREGSYQMVLAEIDQNVVLVIGRTDLPRLRKVLSAYGTYPDGHHG